MMTYLLVEGVPGAYEPHAPFLKNSHTGQVVCPPSPVHGESCWKWLGQYESLQVEVLTIQQYASRIEDPWLLGLLAQRETDP